MQHPSRKAKRGDAGYDTSIALKLPDKLRQALKSPIGVLLKEKDATKANILRFLSAGTYIITVGDATTEKMLYHSLIPSLQIVDGVEKRVKRKPPQSPSTKKLFCDNPAGEITQQSIDTIRKAVGLKPPIQIVVNGEEDLLVIPACIYAPQNAVVLYGQPNEGLVVVPVTEEIRNKTKTILKLMS
jgi:hypothetical protein